MFLLVSVRHVGAHPDELQHGVSIQSSINLGKTFPQISRIRIIPSTQILARVFAYLPPFISQILDFVYWTVLILILIFFEWRDTENQQLGCTEIYDIFWFNFNYNFFKEQGSRRGLNFRSPVNNESVHHFTTIIKRTYLPLV